MKEYIERATVLNLLEKINPVDFGSMFDYEAHGAVQECLREISYGVEDISAADAAEVVRCKDCVWRGREECAMFYRCDCGEQHTWETDNDFCSYGARMDKEDEHEAG